MQWLREFRRSISLPATIVAVGLFFSGGIAGWGIEKAFSQNAGNVRGLVIRQHGYKFISPILSCEVASSETAFPELKEIDKDLTELSGGEINRGKATNISIYLRLLNSARWIGVDEDTKYTPASLMKIVILIAYLKESESDPRILSQEIVFRKNGSSKSAAEDYPEAELAIGGGVPSRRSPPPHDCLFEQRITSPPHQ